LPRRIEVVEDGRERFSSLQGVGRLAPFALRWCLEREIPVIPKSTHRERIAENGQVFDFELTDEDMARLGEVDRTGGTGRAVEQKWW
jgi:diketogulonate reductase-like aldo/keto reductase